MTFGYGMAKNPTITGRNSILRTVGYSIFQEGDFSALGSRGNRGEYSLDSTPALLDRISLFCHPVTRKEAMLRLPNPHPDQTWGGGYSVFTGVRQL